MERLAEAILYAAKLHTESWLCTENHVFDYTISIKEAADAAAGSVGFDTRGTSLIYILLSTPGCDEKIIEWAKQFEKDW